MDIKNHTVLSEKKDGMECNLHCTNDASLGFIFDSLCVMREFILKKMSESVDKPKDEELKE